jgi:hypothetical protein
VAGARVAACSSDGDIDGLLLDGVLLDGVLERS